MIRVSQRKRCPVCDKPEYCSFFDDMRAVICMRIESDKPTKNGGFIHWLVDDWTPPLHRYLERKPRPKIQRDWPALAAKCHAAMTGCGWSVLANDLGLSVKTLKAMQVGWDGSQSRFTFPMRNDAGDVVGIRTREQEGKKSVSGSDGNGLFFIPAMLSPDYLIICEGCLPPEWTLDDLAEHIAERSAIMEHDGRLPRDDAGHKAIEVVRAQLEEQKSIFESAERIKDSTKKN